MDTHTHSNLSFDGREAPSVMIEEAIKKGLSYIAITDHCDFDCELLGFHESGRKIEGGRWYPILQAAKKEYEDRIFVAHGIELGYIKEVVHENAAIVEEFPLDIIINSVHLVENDNPYTAEFFERRTKVQAYVAYLKAIRESIDVPYSYDVISHMGYVARKAPYADCERELTRASAPELVDDILKTIIQKGKALEINTNDIAFGFEPSKDIVKRYKELGGELITLGSDAHTPARIAEKFDSARAWLKSAGFKHAFVYKAREPEAYTL